MSLPSPIGSDACRLAERWGLSNTLAGMLVRLEGQAAERFGRYWPGMFIISGFRSQRTNREVGGAVDSLHPRCPAIAADLRVGNVAGLDSPEVWAILGGMWRLMGGRWGGQFLEPDPNHFDLGI